MARYELNYEVLDENKKEASSAEDYLDWVETIVCAFFVVILIFTFILRVANVDGESMLPTLVDGDRLVVSHLFYEPAQGDIVIVNNINGHVYNSANELETVAGIDSKPKAIVKRVVAVGGQTVNINFETGEVSVNGTVIDEPYINELTKMDEGGHQYPVTVPVGYVFVMGDNRMNSTDSRDGRVGFVAEEDILGKVLLRIFPFDSIGTPA